MTLSSLRRDYPGEPLTEADAGGDPIALFHRWFAAARDQEPDPTAMALATATPGGRPSLRTVLLKDADARGFVWYTNYGSRKARELAANPRASLLFFWRSLDRQIRVDGPVEKVSVTEADAYFQSRPLESRVSVYASRQSEPVESRGFLDDEFARAQARFPDSQIPRPEWWGGYRLVPEEIEFWQGRVHRLHDRLRYVKQSDGSWHRDRLAP